MPDPTTPTSTSMPSPVTSPMPDMNPVTARTMTMPGSFTNPTAPVSNPVTTLPQPTAGRRHGRGNGHRLYAYGAGVPAWRAHQTWCIAHQTVCLRRHGRGNGHRLYAYGAGVRAWRAHQTWCIAKTGMTDKVLQNGIDYACGIGGADCSAIQPMGSCYNPNTVQAHASYAFNSYFQRNPSPASCDFGGAGMLVNVNPSKPRRLVLNSSSTAEKNVSCFI
jgi:hypothetical protein